MGLDMYAFAIANAPDAPVDFEVRNPTELHYWRKHPNLHGWMRALYLDKGGDDVDFNCANVLLTLEDLNRLEADIKARRLPETHGFFFGESDGTETEDDLQFVAKAREAIAAGCAVFYTSWW